MSVTTVAGADGVPAEPAAMPGTAIAARTGSAVAATIGTTIAAMAGSGVAEGVAR